MSASRRHAPQHHPTHHGWIGRVVLGFPLNGVLDRNAAVRRPSLLRGDLFVRDVVSVGNRLAQCDKFVATPELQFLSQKLRQSAAAPLSVVQLCEFDAIRRRAQIDLMELKLGAAEKRARGAEGEIAAQHTRAVDLDVREAKLESFLRLYRLTTAMLDKLPEGTSREEELRRLLQSQKETEEPIEIGRNLSRAFPLLVQIGRDQSLVTVPGHPRSGFVHNTPPWRSCSR